VQSLAYIIVVADLLTTLNDYSSIVDRVNRDPLGWGQNGQDFFNDFNGLHHGYTVRQTVLTVAEWFKSHGHRADHSILITKTIGI
jgi:hypothetical protein